MHDLAEVVSEAVENPEAGGPCPPASAGLLHGYSAAAGSVAGGVVERARSAMRADLPLRPRR